MYLPYFSLFNFGYADFSNIIRNTSRILIAIAFTIVLAACGRSGGDKPAEIEEPEVVVETPTQETGTGGEEVVDTTPPVIALIGNSIVTVELATTYTDSGATAVDETDGNITPTLSGSVNTTLVGSYTLTYTATDEVGNTSTLTRTVNVIDTIAPVITLNGADTISIYQGDTYTELGATATDAQINDITIVITGNLNTATAGSYTITYTATDEAGNTSTLTRTVVIEGIFVLNGEANITIIQNSFYRELGVTVSGDDRDDDDDDRDGGLDVLITGSVDTSVIGVYTITYSATNSEGLSLTLTRTVTVIEPTPFITTWQTNHPSADYSYASDENQIKIGTRGTGYNFTIDWGDGTVEHNQTEGKTHTYAKEGIYTITITGAFPRLYSDFYFNRYDNSKLLSVEQWGNNQWVSMAQAFHSANNVVFNAKDTPDLSQVTSMSEMFYNATSFNSDISQWDVSNVTAMNNMFRNATSFNQDISGWDVSNVINMFSMFQNASAFNRDISGWDVSNVTTMEDMFNDAKAFNQDIGGWNVAKVRDMESMFEGATYFNQDLSKWDVSNVTTMRRMFDEASGFNQNISTWQVQNVSNMSDMFNDAYLSVSNYDAMLNAWSLQTLKTGVSLTVNSYYSSASSSARDSLASIYQWAFNDLGKLPEDADSNSPNVLLIGNSQITISVGTDYIELGARSIDDRDGVMPVTMITGTVDTSQLGEYTLTYTATDTAGNIGTATRTVNVVVVDILNPTISLSGQSSITLKQNEEYVERGATASDARDGALTPVITGEVDDKTTGTYILTYTATDAAGNSASVTRTVIVPVDTTPPVITLNGNDVIKLTINTDYTELNATAEDWRDGVIDEVIITGSVNTAVLGNYLITYMATDAAGNDASATRTVQVLNPDVAVPSITLTGGDTIDWTQGFDYNDLGFFAFDVRDGELTVEVEGEVDGTTTGAYTLTYTATDAAGNVTVVTRTVNVVAPTPFITTWRTNAEGGDDRYQSASNQIRIGTAGSGYNFTIDWGDGTVEENQTAGKTHTYLSPGTYQIKITGAFPRLYFDASRFRYDNKKLLSVDQWGNNHWASMAQAFHSTSNLEIRATDTPVLHQVTSMSEMFYDNTSFNNDITAWDVSNVTNMNSMFYNAFAFNQDISAWDVSNVIDMESMFHGTRAFNINIGNWDVSKVQSMTNMFGGTRAFNIDIGNWDVSNVTNMGNMFSGAEVFNRDIGNWDVSKVTNMSNMFNGATDFNKDISGWDVSNVVSMNKMFQNATAFNQPIGDWKPSKVNNMSGMFFAASSFNQDLSGWKDELSNVTSMLQMFTAAIKFNQDVTEWDVSNVTNMQSMFQSAIDFNQDIGAWNVSNVTNMQSMFQSTASFNQNINDWDISNVSNITLMFASTSAFNKPLDRWKDKLSNLLSLNQLFSNARAFDQDISDWDVSNVTQMINTFFGANSFNQDISTWDVSSVTRMTSTFRNADKFNQDISAWDVSSVTQMDFMFNNAVAFNQNLGDWNIENVVDMNFMFSNASLSIDNYDALLNAWSVKNIKPNVRFYVSSNYSTNASAARDLLVNTNGWTITDNGELDTSELDTTAPVITLNGNAADSIVINTPYIELGANARDDRDGPLVVTITGSVNTTITGNYDITYTATDAAGNVSTATRVISVLIVDTVKPVISLIGKSVITLSQDEAYSEEGAVASDARDGNLNVTVTGSVDSKTTGTYTLTYTAVDNAGNTHSITRDVIVPVDTSAPIITLIGDELLKYTINARPYVELGANATDWREGGVDVVITGDVNTSILGDYIITYTAKDSLGNSGSITRTVQVLNPDITGPDITLGGYNGNDSVLEWTQGYDYQDFDASAFDTRDGTVTVTSSGVVNSNTTGTYTITYTATDEAGNTTTVTRTVNVVAPTPFITVWQTDAEGGDDRYQSANNQIRIGTTGSGYNFTIDWGDGTVEENQTEGKTHTYQSSGTYTIKITGPFPRLYFREARNGYDNAKILSVEQWGNNYWQSMEQAFLEANNLEINATDKPILIQVTSTESMFQYAEKFNTDIGDWDVSNVTDMDAMFYGAREFDQDISGWDVSNAIKMYFMFAFTDKFNQDISNWDVSSVTSMEGMFRSAIAFNQDINLWDVSNVSNFREMFNTNPVFNHDLNDWDVSNADNMDAMFDESVFNSDISNWDVSNVTNMRDMFKNNSVFNKDISQWDVSSVTNMHGMFENAAAFNQDISQWDTNSVTNMSNMFLSASAFNRNIGEWDMSFVINVSDMLYNSALSTTNYNAILNGWSLQTLKPSLTTRINLMYSSEAEAARQHIIDTYGWTINDNGLEP